LEEKRKQLEMGKKGLEKRRDYLSAANEVLANKKSELENVKEQIKKLEEEIATKEEEKIKSEEKETIAKEIKQLQNPNEAPKPAEEHEDDDIDEEEDKSPDFVEKKEEKKKEETEEEKKERETKIEELRQKLNNEDVDSVISVASDLREELVHKRAELSTLRARETEINKFFETDFGPENIWASLYDKCFETQVKEYTYKVCLFKKSTQSGTDIGNWKEWKEKYTIQTYDGGAFCWNGPNRQTTLVISCGEEEKITSVSEPSKCMYETTFETPVACSPDDINNLELLLSGEIRF